MVIIDDLRNEREIDDIQTFLTFHINVLLLRIKNLHHKIRLRHDSVKHSGALVKPLQVDADRVLELVVLTLIEKRVRKQNANRHKKF